MPHLQFFIPCEKVLFTKDNLISIISVVENITITLEPDTAVPQDAITPTTLQIISQWRRTPEDEGKKFEQLLQLITPTGTDAVKGSTDFTMEHDVMRQTATLNHFPIGQEGEFVLRLSFREIGMKKWKNVAEYIIRLIHKIEGDSTEPIAPQIEVGS